MKLQPMLNILLQVNAPAMQMSGRSVSPLVLSYPTGSGTLYIGIDGPIQDNHPGNGGLRIWKYSCERVGILAFVAMGSFQVLTK